MNCVDQFLNIRLELWDLGYDLCQDSAKSFPVTFLAGDALNPTFLSQSTSNTELHMSLDLTSLKSLNPLKGKVSAIYAVSFFHVSVHRVLLLYAVDQDINHDSYSMKNNNATLHMRWGVFCHGREAALYLAPT